MITLREPGIDESFLFTSACAQLSILRIVPSLELKCQNINCWPPTNSYVVYNRSRRWIAQFSSFNCVQRTTVGSTMSTSRALLPDNNWDTANKRFEPITVGCNDDTESARYHIVYHPRQTIRMVLQLRNVSLSLLICRRCGYCCNSDLHTTRKVNDNNIASGP